MPIWRFRSVAHTGMMFMMDRQRTPLLATRRFHRHRSQGAAFRRVTRASAGLRRRGAGSTRTNTPAITSTWGPGKKHPVDVLIKVTSKPGRVYEQDLENEIATLGTINRELPDSRYFPHVYRHGHLGDGRLYLVMSLFDEFPLATTIGTEPAPGRLVAHLMAAIEVARALAEIHRLEIFHVDLNPMNILYRTEGGRPVIRLVDFESSYERSRHAQGVFYNPPTTPGYTAPEAARRSAGRPVGFVLAWRRALRAALRRPVGETGRPSAPHSIRRLARCRVAGGVARGRRHGSRGSLSVGDDLSGGAHGVPRADLARSILVGSFLHRPAPRSASISVIAAISPVWLSSMLRAMATTSSRVDSARIALAIITPPS